MTKPAFLTMTMALLLMIMSCEKQHESIYLNAKEGVLRVNLHNLQPVDVDSAIFRFTGTGPFVQTIKSHELVLDLTQLHMGQYLTEVEVHSHMLNASNNKDLAIKRQDILNTYILIHTLTLGIVIPGPGDERKAWTSTLEAYYRQHPESLEVQTMPQSAFVGVSVDSSKTIYQLTLSRTATVAGRKAEPVFLTYEKIYTAAEFYQLSSNTRKMVDGQGFAAFQNKLKSKDLRKMTYRYKVQYTDGTKREFEFSARF